MDLEAVRVLMSVVEHGTVQGAAEALRTSRATIRRRLQELEASAGVPLLVRGTRGITSTEAGRLLAERGRLVVEDMSVLLEQVRSTSARSALSLRVLLADGMAPHYVARLLLELLGASPELRVDLRQCADPLAELMEDVDVAVVLNQGEREGPWHKLPVAPAPERLLASPTYLAANPVESVDDLADHRLLIWRSPEYPINELPLRSGGTVRITPHVISTNIHVLHHMALADGGIAFVPDGGAHYESAASDALVRLLPDEVGRSRWLSVVAAESLRSLPKIQEMMVVMQGFAASLRGATRRPA